MEVKIQSRQVELQDASAVAAARRAAMRVCDELLFDETTAGNVAIITTEAARNALIHGGTAAQAVITGVRNSHHGGIDIWALDNGKGIGNLPEAMRDGFSTAGTPGTGLGALKRLSSELDIFTGQNGTSVFCRALTGKAPAEGLRVAGFSVPVQGESACGDSWSLVRSPERTLVMMVDGLGHGPDAAYAAQEAVLAFQQNSQRGPVELLSLIHENLKKTRGAAGAIAEIRPAEKTLAFAGIGNIAGILLSDSVSRNLVSYNGILGGAFPHVQSVHSEWPASAILIMHSDGIQTRWDLSRYPGLLNRHPGTIAGVLFRDFRRKRDDSSVVVIRN
jgi:anti-sigma regulatory factor (Ser/Thr protein kinase)